MDYKKLLQKYAQFVYDSEGTDFLSEDMAEYVKNLPFSLEEIEALKEISKGVKLIEY